MEAVLKLIRIDTENPYKINFKTGSCVVGRGKFRDFNDKRISRKHGRFEVSDDSLKMTALHKNPCFYKKKGTMEVKVLNENNSVSLNSGDELGFLPRSFWYQVLQSVPSNNENKEYPERNTPDGISTDTSEETDDDEEPPVSPVASGDNKILHSTQNDQDTQVLSSYELNKDQNNMDVDNENQDDQNKSTSKANSEDSRLADFSSDDNHPGSPSLISTKLQEELPKDPLSSSEQVVSPLKRPHDVSEDGKCDEVKRVKSESEDQPDIKPDLNDLNVGQAGSSNSNVGDSKTVPPPAQAPLRERCMYGTSCYRRNPQHRSQFSHPQDADWGAGARAPCPWGAACAKRDPRHWRDHDHPPGKDQPLHHQGQRVVHRQGNIYYINAHTVNFNDDDFDAEDSDGNSVDFDYEF